MMEQLPLVRLTTVEVASKDEAPLLEEKKL